MSGKGKQKKPVLNVAGRRKYNSFKDYLKDLEDTMTRLHTDTVSKSTKGRK
jgi:hypothetical protein